MTPPGVPPTGAAADAGAAEPPGIWRRMACWLYEGVVLFGVVMIAGYLFSSLTQQRHALVGRHGLQAFLFVVLGIYFVWFWSKSGQTVAMKAWHIRVVGPDGHPPGEWRALARYLLAWLWFVPALATLGIAPLAGGVAVTAVVGAGIAAYALLAWLRPDRQFLHDVLAGTRLVTWRPPPRDGHNAAR